MNCRVYGVEAIYSNNILELYCNTSAVERYSFNQNVIDDILSHIGAKEESINGIIFNNFRAITLTIESSLNIVVCNANIRQLTIIGDGGYCRLSISNCKIRVLDLMRKNVNVIIEDTTIYQRFLSKYNISSLKLHNTSIHEITTKYILIFQIGMYEYKPKVVIDIINAFISIPFIKDGEKLTCDESQNLLYSKKRIIKIASEIVTNISHIDNDVINYIIMSSV